MFREREVLERTFLTISLTELRLTPVAPVCAPKNGSAVDLADGGSIAASVVAQTPGEARTQLSLQDDHPNVHFGKRAALSRRTTGGARNASGTVDLVSSHE
ncbi:hypothetical protein H8A97_03760 [Bradyrhizobium sp. Arg62]|uniref:hypothetical protein n=1 Tax=Bradyrhizobium brasilense TaxID=1419277 RepID=UPI001E288CBB|nr:hypothetical protein [Bradyrhizobium brasilense]MCC8944240.1 hypothetical protein [Bradyrhizobium brasilense]